MKTIAVIKRDKVLKGTLRLPSSKSISNRLLILRALADEDFGITNLSDADDTILLGELLEKIGLRDPHRQVIELDTANAGTVLRFLTAFLSLKPGKWILTGSERMKQRPVGILVDAMRSLGADIDYLGKLGYPPLMIKGRQLKGGEIRVDPGISSQFISALVLIAPGLPGGLSVFMHGHPVSFPYISMTLSLLNYFGVAAKREKNRIFIPESVIKGKDFTVESDWSAAAFWYEAVALADEADLVLEGLQKDSLQGDAVLAGIFENFGVTTEFLKDKIRLTKTKKRQNGFFFDFNDNPDIAPAVITTCAALGLRGRFEGLKGLRLKETDRLQALGKEYRKIGVHIEEDSESGIMPVIEFPGEKLKPLSEVRISTYGDHRMAMAFAPLALKLGTIHIENPKVVSKSYPQFWEDLASLGFEIT